MRGVDDARSGNQRMQDVEAVARGHRRRVTWTCVLLGVALWLRLKLGRLGETAWNGDPAAAALGHGTASRI